MTDDKLPFEEGYIPFGTENGMAERIRMLFNTLQATTQDLLLHPNSLITKPTSTSVIIAGDELRDHTKFIKILKVHSLMTAIHARGSKADDRQKKFAVAADICFWTVMGGYLYAAGKIDVAVEQVMISAPFRDGLEDFDADTCRDIGAALAACITGDYDIDAVPEISETMGWQTGRKLWQMMQDDAVLQSLLEE